MHDDIERILFGEQEIRAGIERLAGEIRAVYAGEEPTVIAVLKGSVVFVADLIRCLPIPLHLAFVWAESYRQGTTSGRLELGALPPAAELAGRRILLVDDILDTGRTLHAIRAEILARGAREVRTCVFLDKPARRAVELEADHVCFHVDDVFVVGYGLDYRGRYRNLPYVGALKPRVLAGMGTLGGGGPVSETIVVPWERAGLELDEFLCLHFPEFNKGFLRRAVRDGQILIDGMRAQPSQRLRADQVLLVDLDETEAPPAPVAPEGALPILYEDEDLLVVDKPAGLAVEPERWARGAASLAGALLAMAHARSPDGDAGPLELRLRAVHRLDKDTSGVLVVAKQLEAERALRAAFEHDRVQKTYWALVEGEHPLADGEEEEIDLALGPDEKRSGRMVVDPDGKPARTRIAVLQRFRGFTWLACRPLSGRTHQIRVHLAARGFPLAVDPLYGRRDELLLSNVKAGYRAKPGRPERPLIERLTLHAAAIELPSPRDAARTIRVEAPLPKDLSQLLKQLAKVRAWRT